MFPFHLFVFRFQNYPPPETSHPLSIFRKHNRKRKR